MVSLAHSFPLEPHRLEGEQLYVADLFPESTFGFILISWYLLRYVNTPPPRINIQIFRFQDVRTSQFQMPIKLPVS